MKDRVKKQRRTKKESQSKERTREAIKTEGGERARAPRDRQYEKP
jgi:hypothetical protein